MLLAGGGIVKILVVDDEPLARKAMASLLSRFDDLEVVADCEDTFKAMKVLQEKRVDLMFLDIQMPGGDGLSCLEDIRAIDRDAIVIMVTALGRGPAEEESREKGASGYLVKPFQPEQLYEVIDHCLSDHEQGGWSH